MTLRNLKTASPREIARQLSRSRRDFLRDAAGVALGGSLPRRKPVFARREGSQKTQGHCRNFRRRRARSGDFRA